MAKSMKTVFARASVIQGLYGPRAALFALADGRVIRRREETSIPGVRAEAETEEEIECPEGYIRVRHFTAVNRMKLIQQSMIILASDQFKVFVVKAKGKPKSPRVIEAELGIKKGRGNAYIDFDACRPEVLSQLNPSMGRTELYIPGNVNLNGRDPTFNLNR